MSEAEKPREFPFPFSPVPPVPPLPLGEILERIATALEMANQLTEQRNAISREALDLQKELIEQEQANRARTTYVEPDIKVLANKVSKEMAQQIRQQSRVRHG